jgi:Uncharacterised nucleotidyltransferase
MGQRLTAKAAFLPTPVQQLLLRACLFNGEDAIAAWRSWRTTIDFDRIDSGSIRLLPVLAENLSRCGVDETSLGIYRGVQRRTWARNQLLFRSAAQVSKRFHERGIPVLALKGVVLASTCYAHMSLRPMGDFDFLVRGSDRRKAIDELERLGWRLQDKVRPQDEADFAIRHACAFKDSENSHVSIDLHWRLLWAQSSEAAASALWEQAVPYEIGDVQVLAPCAADMLLHVCVHGAKWNDVSPIRWIVDATLLLRNCKIDWVHLRRQSARLRVDLQLARTLTYLRDVMRVALPEEILQDLAQSQAQPIERLLYEAELNPPERRNLKLALRLHWHLARSQMVPSHGVFGYWWYFVALRSGRSLGEIAAWTYSRLCGWPNR